MRETVTSEFNRTTVTLPAGASDAAAFAACVTARSQIVWGEHCSECDYPRCYASCSFYDPRPDLHCRRFVAGIEGAAPEPGASSGLDHLTRIRFRKWGKLEGRGPAPLVPVAVARARENTDAAVSQALASVPMPFAVRRNLTFRWNNRKSPAATAGSATAFVVEGWSLDGTTRQFTLTFLQDHPRRTVHQTPFELTAVYGRIEVPVRAIAAEIDLAQPFLVQIEPVGEAEGIDIVLGLTDFVVAAEIQTGRPSVKVVVWDLDETLWHGTLSEDGIAGVTPRPEAIAAVKALDARGILNSIASKNDETEALAALSAFGLVDYFLHPQVNWGPKSASVAKIAQALDLGLDSFVFLDDQPFERAEVVASHDKVRVLPETAVTDLLNQPGFDQPVTPESQKRRALYRAEAARHHVFEAAGGDYLAFLRSSDLTLEVADLDAASAERVFELSQRTNQLNFTGAKFTRQEVQQRLTATCLTHCLTLRCRDRFGDYGLIGFAELDLPQGRLVQFFMSCRVQRKRVEHAFFDLAGQMLGAAGQTNFAVDFKPTERNGASVRMLTELGFADSPTGWTRPLDQGFAEADIVRVSRS